MIIRDREFTRYPDLIRKEMFSPISLYAIMFDKIQVKPRNEVYIGGPATSGLARRLLPRLGNGEITSERLSTIIGINRFILHSCTREIEAFPGYRFTIPLDIGNRLGKNEFDINLFALLYMTGIPLDFAANFYDQIKRHDSGIDFTRFNDHSLANKKQRRDEYQKLFQIYINIVGYLKIETNPIAAVVFGPDWRTSLGCNLEAMIATAFNIPLYQMYFNSQHPRYNMGISNNGYFMAIEQAEIEMKTPTEERFKRPELFDVGEGKDSLVIIK